ncbi:MAG: MarR family transcriptional regulator [Spirochaetota bacterium]
MPHDIAFTIAVPHDTVPKTASPDDPELAVLESLYQSGRRADGLTQRQLARAAGISLGLVNALLKRCAGKGWVLLRRASPRQVEYALTPAGVSEIAHRTYRYLRRSARSARAYRDLFEAFVLGQKAKGIRTVVLAGHSDLDFILEYASERHGLCFAKGADAAKAVALARNPDTIVVLSEELDGHDIPATHDSALGGHVVTMEQVLVPGIGV